jgi:hypothetical protein
MSDRELLELAAKAARCEKLGAWDDKLGCLWDGEGWTFDPLNDDGDALRLAADTCLRIDFNYHTGSDKQQGVGVWTSGDDSPFPPFWTRYGRTPDRDVRNTIVRAAASLAKATP